ncbi:MAG TPA: nitroreductase family deazaflavin-dependent oxidoreductase [Ktedonobacterales bacterium]
MPAPRWLARVNRRVTNRVLGVIAPYAPGFGVIIHTGRRSGRRYRTPVNLFKTSDGYVFALTYGSETDWIKNVMAAGGCELETHGRHEWLDSPRLIHGERQSEIPRVVAAFLRLLNVHEFLRMHRREP